MTAGRVSFCRGILRQGLGFRVYSTSSHASLLLRRVLGQLQ